MECDACRERAEAFYLNGLKDPLVDDDVWSQFKEDMKNMGKIMMYREDKINVKKEN